MRTDCGYASRRVVMQLRSQNEPVPGTRLIVGVDARGWRCCKRLLALFCSPRTVRQKDSTCAQNIRQDMTFFVDELHSIVLITTNGYQLLYKYRIQLRTRHAALPPTYTLDDAQAFRAAPAQGSSANRPSSRNAARRLAPCVRTELGEPPANLVTHAIGADTRLDGNLPVALRRKAHVDRALGRRRPSRRFVGCRHSGVAPSHAGGLRAPVRAPGARCKAARRALRALRG